MGDVTPEPGQLRFVAARPQDWAVLLAAALDYDKRVPREQGSSEVHRLVDDIRKAAEDA